MSASFRSLANLCCDCSHLLRAPESLFEMPAWHFLPVLYCALVRSVHIGAVCLVWNSCDGEYNGKEIFDFVTLPGCLLTLCSSFCRPPNLTWRGLAFLSASCHMATFMRQSCRMTLSLLAARITPTQSRLPTARRRSQMHLLPWLVTIQTTRRPAMIAA